jgi:hypothetical protein
MIILVDAICINQEDNDEKGQQVSLMSEMYSEAVTVVIWLGKELEDRYRRRRDGRAESFSERNCGPVFQALENIAHIEISPKNNHAEGEDMDLLNASPFKPLDHLIL